MSFFDELKRRNVVRVGIAYALVAWVVLQIVDFLTEVIDAPTWVLQVFVIAAGIGLLAALIFSWVFEMTPEGLKRETEVDRSTSITPQTGRKLDRLIIVFLAVAVAFLLARPYWEEGADPTDTVTSESALSESPAPGTPTHEAATEERSVAVLPFNALSSGEDDEFFADGLTEEILNSLAQLPELLVTARTSAFAFKGQDRPVNEIATELGVRHIVEGSVRRSGDRIRVTAQLIRAEDGFHLWSDTYDSTSDDTITVQEDIAVQIASALDVVMDEERREAMRKAGLRDPAAFVAFQRGLAASREAHGDFDQISGLLEANRYFDEVLERVPDYSPAHTELSDAYVHIINDAATSEPSVENVPPEVRENAYRLAVEAVSAAREHAHNLEERAANEFDLAVITGDFSRIRPRLEAYLSTDHCVIGQWVDPVATVFGYAQALEERLDPVIQCNPLDAVRQFSRARAALWAGDPDRTLDYAAQAREKMYHPWLESIRVDGLIAAGRFESAQQELQRMSYGFTKIDGLRLAAAQGDRATAEALRDELIAESPEGNMGGFFTLQFHAVLGEREAANRLAREIDTAAYGPLPLILVTLWCACGAPFDLEATPKFAASLEQGNLPWPPAAPIEFPLKTW